MSRRVMIGGIVAVAAGAAVAEVLLNARPTQDFHVPVQTSEPLGIVPTAADTVAWADIAEPGKTLNDVLQEPALAGKFLVLPEGIFEVADFRDATQAIGIPPSVRGLVGAGRGTIIRMAAGTSSYASSVPLQETKTPNQLHLLRMNGGKDQLLSGFWLQGTEQGHLYGGMMVYSTTRPTISEVFVSGIPGDSNSPPGETFGVNVANGTGSSLRDVEVDGRRITGDSWESRIVGETVGASPIGWSYHNDASYLRLTVHHNRTGMPTFFACTDIIGTGLHSQSASAGINHEESTQITHIDPILDVAGNAPDVTCDSQKKNCIVTIVNPINNEWVGGAIGHRPGLAAGNRILLQIHKSYAGGVNGSRQKVTTRPIVVDSRGTLIPSTLAT